MSELNKGDKVYLDEFSGEFISENKGVALIHVSGDYFINLDVEHLIVDKTSQLQQRVKELEEENSIIKEALTDRAIMIEGINFFKAGE